MKLFCNFPQWNWHFPCITAMLLNMKFNKFSKEDCAWLKICTAEKLSKKLSSNVGVSEVFTGCRKTLKDSSMTAADFKLSFLMRMWIRSVICCIKKMHPIHINSTQRESCTETGIQRTSHVLYFPQRSPFEAWSEPDPTGFQTRHLASASRIQTSWVGSGT